MAELFQRDKSVISRHIHNMYEEGELDALSTVAKNATVVAGHVLINLFFFYSNIVLPLQWKDEG